MMIQFRIPTKCSNAFIVEHAAYQNAVNKWYHPSFGLRKQHLHTDMFSVVFMFISCNTHSELSSLVVGKFASIRLLTSLMGSSLYLETSSPVTSSYRSVHASSLSISSYNKYAYTYEQLLSGILYVQQLFLHVVASSNTTWLYSGMETQNFNFVLKIPSLCCVACLCTTRTSVRLLTYLDFSFKPLRSGISYVTNSSMGENTY